MREALNLVEAGEMVVITRHKTDFVLTTASHWNDKQVQAQRGFTTLVTDDTSSNIRPDIKTDGYIKPREGYKSIGIDPAKAGADMSFELQTTKDDDGIKIVSAKKIASEPQAALQTIEPRIKNPDTPVRTDDEWKDAEGGELPCCKQSKPCRHWLFNEMTQIWQNSISGRQKQVEL